MDVLVLYERYVYCCMCVCVSCMHLNAVCVTFIFGNTNASAILCISHKLALLLSFVCCYFLLFFYSFFCCSFFSGKNSFAFILRMCINRCDLEWTPALTKRFSCRSHGFKRKFLTFQHFVIFQMILFIAAAIHWERATHTLTNKRKHRAHFHA